jgi:hypothetical protein
MPVRTLNVRPNAASLDAPVLPGFSEEIPEPVAAE